MLQRVRDILSNLIVRAEAQITVLVNRYGATKIAMAGVFVVNYILYELVKRWS